MQGRLLVIVKIYLTFDWVLLVLLANADDISSQYLHEPTSSRPLDTQQKITV